MKFAWPTDGGLALARAMLLAVIVSTLVSTTVAVVVEILTYLLFLFMPTLRRRFVDRLRHPVNVAVLCFALTIVVAAFYGPAPWTRALVVAVAWRRILLLPLAIAVFDDDSSKRLALTTIVLICLVGALVSFVTYAGSIDLTRRLYPGIVFHNYASQGLAMSMAAIICIAGLLRPEAFVGDCLLRNRPVLVGILTILLIDIVFVLSGRTGYLAVALMSSATVTLLFRGTWGAKALMGGAAVVCAVALLSTSPHVRTRIGDGIREIATLDQSPVGTQMGTRVIMWRNSVRMILDHPTFGVGIGGFQHGYRAYVQGVSGWQGYETPDPHNQYLNILGEQGLVGLAAFLFLLCRAFTCLAPSPFRELAVAALVGWCATSLANSDFSVFTEGRLIFFWLGAMLGGPSESLALTRPK